MNDRTNMPTAEPPRRPMRGAAEIAEHLFGDRRQRRRVYHLAEITRKHVERKED